MLICKYTYVTRYSTNYADIVIYTHYKLVWDAAFRSRWFISDVMQVRNLQTKPCCMVCALRVSNALMQSSNGLLCVDDRIVAHVVFVISVASTSHATLFSILSAIKLYALHCSATDALRSHEIFIGQIWFSGFYLIRPFFWSSSSLQSNLNVAVFLQRTKKKTSRIFKENLNLCSEFFL